MAGPIIAGEHPCAQAIFAAFVIMVFCILLVPDALVSKFSWLRWLIDPARHLMRLN